MDTYRFFAKTSKALLLALLAVLPLFFLPVTGEYFDTNKWMLFVLTSLVVLFLWAGRLLVTGKAAVSWSGTTVGFGLLAAAGFLSLTFSSFHKITALLSPFGPLTWIAGTVILFFGASLLSEREKILLRLALAVEGGVAGLLALYQHLGLAALFFRAGSPYADPFFTPLGSTASLVTFLLLTLPISVSVTLHALKSKKDVIAGVSVVTAVLALCGIGVTLWKYVPVARTQILPIILGIRLTVSSWDSIPRLFFGTGPEKFFEIYTLYRPQSVNMSPIWNTAFQANASLALHIATTLGLTGLLCFFVFLGFLRKEWATHPVTHIQALLFIALSLFAPPALLLAILPVLLLVTSYAKNEVGGEIHGFGRYFISFFLLSLTLLSFYGLFRWHKGERLLFQSFRAAEGNNGSRTFMLEEQALKTNPTNPNFHMALAQTSLSLAENIMRTAPVDENNVPKLTEDEKTLLTDLASRGIQEAKLAIALSPDNVHAWLVLARVYQGLIGLAKDADTWAIAAYQKSFELDPTNPVLHLNLGGLYMSLERTEDAGKEFIASIVLKPNYIDGFYNLANAFRQKGDWDNAIKSLEQTKMLIAKGTTDETKIEQEILSILEEKKTKGTSVQPTSLYVPELNLPTQ